MYRLILVNTFFEPGMYNFDYHLQLCETFFSMLQVLAEGPLGG